MKNKKYFAVDVSNDVHIVELHDTLEGAKQSCLQHAKEAYDFAEDMDSFEEYSGYDLPYAIYGVVLGQATSTTRQLTKEEAESGDYDDVDEIINQPEIVELNGWISVDEALPEFPGYYLVFCPYWANSVCSVEFNLDLGDFLECADEITHWQPLPQPPETEQSHNIRRTRK